MATKTTDNRLDEIHRHIDDLRKRASTVSTQARASIEHEVDALQAEEASARDAMRTAKEKQRKAGAEHVQAVEEKVTALETRVKAAEHSLAADAAEDKKTFTDAMERYLADWDAFIDRTKKRIETNAGAAKTRAEGALTELRQRRDAVAAQVAEARAAAGERWREGRERVDAERAKLERKAEELSKKLD